MKKITKEFLIRPGEAVDLKRRPTRVNPVCGSKHEYKQLLDEHVVRLSALQELLYASNRHAVLIIFQAMDAAGKDGCIKHVMSGVNPQGCDVFSYSHPSPAELGTISSGAPLATFRSAAKSSFLTARTTRKCSSFAFIRRSCRPRPCRITARVERSGRKGIAPSLDLERHLRGNGTRIVKFFLHVSKEEQRRRLLDRIDTQEKNWKIKPSDIEERKYWNQYGNAYEECLSSTSTREAPWYVVPADDKLTARLFVSHIILRDAGRSQDDLPRDDIRAPKGTAGHAEAARHRVGRLLGGDVVEPRGQIERAQP